MKMVIRRMGLFIARAVGSQIIDYQSGQKLGRALLLVWRGKIHVIGLETAVRPVFLPQKRLTYWKQEIGFTAHASPDFPSHRQIKK
jgi:hypothetical protein